MAGTRTNTGNSTVTRDQVKAMIDSVVKAKFASTLGQVQDITNLVLAQIQYESSFQPNAVGNYASITGRTTGSDYINSVPVAAVLTSGTPTERTNAKEGIRAFGLGQIMGWNFIKGGSLRNNKCEIERLRPDLVSTLCIEAGQDLYAHLLGLGNLEKIITAQLVILEGRYKAVTQNSNGYTTIGDQEQRHYGTKIEAAFSAYLGLGKADVNRTNPRVYTQSIYYGNSYKKANGNDFSVALRIAQPNGAPNTNGSGTPRIVPPGC